MKYGEITAAQLAGIPEFAPLFSNPCLMEKRYLDEEDDEIEVRDLKG